MAKLRRTMLRKQIAQRKANDTRREFRFDFARCMMPGCKETQFRVLHCHEICQGIFRAACMLEPSLWLVLCLDCHARIHRENWPDEKQIGLRKLYFPDDDSRAAWLRVTGRPETAIDAELILEWSKHFAKEAQA